MRERESINGKYYLAQTYLQGEGTEQDDEKAIYWLESAAISGNSEAQYVLGTIYYYGENYGLKVQKDSDYAIQLFEKSAKSGNLKAKKELEKIKGIL